MLDDAVVVDETRQTWTEGGLTHTHGTIEERGTRLRTLGAQASTGGHLASVAAGTCTRYGSDIQKVFDTICGAGCITQWMQRTVDLESNSADAANTYYRRVEVRVWWERQYTTGIYFTGNATTTWQDEMVDCNGTYSPHDVYSSWAPQWNTWDRSYDYYWDETWLPTVGGPDAFHMYLTTDTPESYGPDLFTAQTYN